MMETKSMPKDIQNNARQLNPIAYTWKSVVTGGGGFIPGIIFHPLVPGLCYVRTDMGGAYRRNSHDEKWLNITDMFGKEDSDYYGVLSIAVDVNDADTLYMLNGKYSRAQDKNAAFHISKDRGNTWKRILLPFKAGGNEPGRGAGERIAVDPINGSVIMMGTTKNGLWKSVDSGLTWERQENFFPLAINFVVFDRASAGNAPACKRIFAAAADTSGNSLFVSEDGGSSWIRLEGQPTGVMALRAEISGRNIYITFSDSPGPYGAKIGSVWKYKIETKEWKNLNLPKAEGGFSGISIDAKNSLHMLASTLNNYKPHDEVYRSLDGGTSWSGTISGADWDSSYAPYAGEIQPHWIADVKIDPFDQDRAMWVTGFGIWSTKNLSGNKIRWYFDDEGIEQTVAMEIISPPVGAALFSAMGDVDGFRHDDLDKAGKTRHAPNAHTTLAMAFAWKNPAIMAKAFNSKPPYGGYSKDSGRNWIDFDSYPAGAIKGGLKSIAVSADGRTIVWAPKGAEMSKSGDYGITWNSCGGGMAAGLMPFADTLNEKRFYAFDGVKGVLWESIDCGNNFVIRTQNLPKQSAYPGDDGMSECAAAAVPRAEGEIYVAAGRGGFFRLQNGSGEAVKIQKIQEAFRVGFGKEIPGNMYPVVYIWATINDVTGIYMSGDEGRSWARINDDKHQYGWIHCITGDPKKYGRCYISAEGRGILYGEPVRQD
jgi:photosystem II stability/assembly factor-like uncharacterized protein